LNRNLWCATIHREENLRLTRSKMPKDWDKERIVNIFARYETAKEGKIELFEHNIDYLYN
ncbi:MAG: hypothetical protein R3250_09550, partial [Melioribacteraceae bacterium]|nr:hypothetical protein [Melioribacteraceae bacterium]